MEEHLHVYYASHISTSQIDGQNGTRQADGIGDLELDALQKSIKVPRERRMPAWLTEFRKNGLIGLKAQRAWDTYGKWL